MRYFAPAPLFTLVLVACYPAYQRLGRPGLDPGLSEQARDLNDRLTRCHSDLDSLARIAYGDRRLAAKLTQVTSVIAVVGGGIAGLGGDDETTRWIGAGLSIASGSVGVFHSALTSQGSENNQSRGAVRELWRTVVDAAAAYENARRSYNDENARTLPPELAPPGHDAERAAWQQQHQQELATRLASSQRAEAELRSLLASCSAQR